MVQFIKFGIVGVGNTVVSYVIYALIFHFTGNYLLASVVSWLISVLHAYFWQNVFVFRQDETEEKRVWWKVLIKTYMAYAFTGLLVTNILLWLWIDVVDISQYCTGIISFLAVRGISLSSRDFSGYAAPILNMFITVPLNYFINKFWAYKS